MMNRLLLGLRRALVRALLSVFVGLGILVALMAGRGSPRKRAAVPVPAPDPMHRPRRLGPALAVLALLLGIGLIWTVSRGGDFTGSGPQSRSADGSDDGSERAVAALSPAQIGPGPDAPNRSGAPAANPDGPRFDIVRVEPNGDVVVAGRAAPNSVVELLVDGKPVAKAVADADGRFAVVPPALAPGNSEIGLRATDARSGVLDASERVAVVVSPSRDAKPLVALTAPGKATVVLSRPDAAGRAPTAGAPQTNDGKTALDGITARDGMAAPGKTTTGDPAMAGTDLSSGKALRGAVAETLPGAMVKAAPGPDAAAKAAPVKIVSVDAQEGGRLFVTGQAAAGATVRFYLNDTLIAPASVGRDGTVTFTIGRGVKSGAYKVRLDQVDAVSGQVRSRVEVPFAMPDSGQDTGVATAENPDAARAGVAETVPAQTALAQTAPARMPDSGGSPAATPDPSRSAPGSAAVFVPEINTARIVRGDSLWEISRRTYGAGDRYTVIYDANQDQIRNPDLIYPGQIFVLPSEDATAAGPAERRG